MAAKLERDLSNAVTEADAKMSAAISMHRDEVRFEQDDHPDVPLFCFLAQQVDALMSRMSLLEGSLRSKESAHAQLRAENERLLQEFTEAKRQLADAQVWC